MNAMISELLEFARGGARPRAGRRRPRRAPLRRPRGPRPGRSRPGQVEVGPLPVVRGDPVQLRTVLQNLVANAVKFSGRGAQVRVGAEEQANGWWIGVADRGPGIPEQDRERAFEPMVRLDRTRPGSGIGLATCRRIVQRARRPDGHRRQPRRRGRRVVRAARPERAAFSRGATGPAGRASAAARPGPSGSVSSSTSIRLTTVPAASDSSAHTRWGRSIRFIVEQ